MQPRLGTFGLMAIFLLPLIAEAMTFEAKNIGEVMRHIKKGAWVVSDLDNTAMQAQQACGHADWFYETWQNNMRNGMNSDEAVQALYPEWVAVQEVCPVKPVEDGFIPALRELQRQGHVVMALTHRQPILADATLRQIASLGFTFAATSPGPNNFYVPATLYKDGVLLTGEYNKKGEIFMHFLRHIDQWPSEVAFIDDREEHVKEVVKTLTENGVKCIGIHYTAIEFAEKIYDPKIALFQHRVFGENKEAGILSNEEAKTFMEWGKAK